MIQGTKRVYLTMDLLLSKVSEFDIYQHYLGRDFAVGRKLKSPFRDDSTPSFNVFYTKRGNLYHTDFGDMNFKGGCVDLVMQLYGIGYSQALERINRDLCTGIDYEPFKKYTVNNPEPISGKQYRVIKVASKRFTKKGLEFWNQYHITPEELKLHDIYQVKEITMDGSRIPIGKDELVFGYRRGDRWKVYRPETDRKENKWYPNNVPNDTMEGLDTLKAGNPCIITKSSKDRIILLKFYPHVCSTQNESIAAINPKNLAYIQENSSVQYVNFDNDATGKKQSMLFTSTYGFKHINVPDYYAVQGIKDFSDMAKFLGLEAVENYLKHKKII